MSSTYKIQSGDTYELIARKKYGDDQRASNIAAANPGAMDPLIPNTFIVIPDLQDVAGNLEPLGAGVDEVFVIIDNRRFRYWDTITINRSIDSFDTVEFTAPFESDNLDFRNTFRPFTFKPILIYIGKELLFTGTVVDVLPPLEENKKSVRVSCYSKPGVINDCNPPASQFPIEWNDINIVEVAYDLCKPFGISVSIEGDSGTPFDRVACKPQKKIFQFLAGLAQQRNLIMSSDEKGKLVFLQPVEPGNPVAILRQGEPPLTSVTPTFKPQQYYSHITGLESVALGSDGSQYTMPNSRLFGVLRPYSFAIDDVQGGDVPTAVETQAGRMFANIATYSIYIPSWRDPSGNLWKPNTTLKLFAPDAMIYSEFEFLIKRVVMTESGSKGATLELIIPGSFSGKLPERVPWDD